MKIGILGAGNVGGKLAKLARTAGHDVRVGSGSGDVSFEQAIEHAEIVVIAIHYNAVATALGPLKDALAGKIIVDATNPLNEDWSPLLLGQDTSGAEEIAQLLPSATVVKAFNTIFADVMEADLQDCGGQPITAFVAGDDQDARAQIGALAASLGFAPVLVHSLTAARYLEAMAHLNIALAVGQGGGTNAAFLYHQG